MTDISYRNYWAEIRSLCQQVYEVAKERQEEPYEVLWETLDGHRWVIYTAYAFDVLEHSNNDGYAIDEWGADGIVENGSIAWNRLVFGAMLADCLECEDFDFDWQEIPEQEETSTP